VFNLNSGKTPVAGFIEHAYSRPSQALGLLLLNTDIGSRILLNYPHTYYP
jgi:hypothetical protein